MCLPRPKTNQITIIMGQCYSVYLKVRYKDEEGAKAALQNKIAKGGEENINYAIDKFAEIGIRPDTLDGLISIFLANWENNLKKDKEGRYLMYESDFDASYGWERVMMDMFDEIAPYLHDGSSLKIYPDSGVDYAEVRDGKSVWLK